jgi:tRNA uridine 5-carboxymethylaminomethyl modification enzyme
VEEKRRAIERELHRLEETWLRPTEQANEALRAGGLAEIDDGVNALALLRRPESTYALIRATVPADEPVSNDVAVEVEIQAKYAGYIARQEAEVARIARLESRRIPAYFDYTAVPGLRNEARERLVRYRPLTIGQAARLSGVNPADVVILTAHIDRQDLKSTP